MSLKIENSRRVAKSRPISVWTFIKRHYIIIATIINAKPKVQFICRRQHLVWNSHAEYFRKKQSIA